MPEHIEEDVEHEGDGAEVQVGVEPWHSPILTLSNAIPLNRQTGTGTFEKIVKNCFYLKT